MKKLISILLAVVMAATGYFGVAYAITGRTPMRIITGNVPAPVSDIPTDANGNNLFGNHPANLHNGGFVTMQGRDLFFANFADGGSLYSQDARGNITKLLDFPVANLNIIGDRLVFTDLQYCSYIDRSNGQPASMSANSHQEVWAAAYDDEHISYGGNLYYLDGIKRFMAGEIEYEDMSLSVVADQLYLSPNMTAAGRLIVLAVANDYRDTDGEYIDLSPPVTPMSARSVSDITSLVQPLGLTGNMDATSFIQPLGMGLPNPPPSFKPHEDLGANTVRFVNQTNSTCKTVTLKARPGELIAKSAVVGNTAYVETYTWNPEKEQYDHRINVIDLLNGHIRGSYPGKNLQVNDNAAYFQDGNRIYGHDPFGERDGTGGVAHQINAAPADSNYSLKPDGSIEYSSNYTHSNGRTETVHMRASMDPDIGVFRTNVVNPPSTIGRRINNASGKGEIYWDWNDPKKTSGSWVYREYIRDPLNKKKTIPDLTMLDDWNKIISTAERFLQPQPVTGLDWINDDPNAPCYKPPETPPPVQQEPPLAPDPPTPEPQAPADPVESDDDDCSTGWIYYDNELDDPVYQNRFQFWFKPDGTYTYKLSFGDIDDPTTAGKVRGDLQTAIPVRGTYTISGDTIYMHEHDGDYKYEGTINPDGSKYFKIYGHNGNLIKEQLLIRYTCGGTLPDAPSTPSESSFIDGKYVYDADNYIEIKDGVFTQYMFNAGLDGHPLWGANIFIQGEPVLKPFQSGKEILEVYVQDVSPHTYYYCGTHIEWSGGHFIKQ